MQTAKTRPEPKQPDAKKPRANAKPEKATQPKTAKDAQDHPAKEYQKQAAPITKIGATDQTETPKGGYKSHILTPATGAGIQNPENIRR